MILLIISLTTVEQIWTQNNESCGLPFLQ